MKANKHIRKNRFKPEPGSARKGSGETASGFMVVLDFLVRTTMTLAAVCIMSVGFIFIHDLAIQADYFCVPTVEINGIHRLSRDEVMDAAGLKDGENVLGINLLLVKKRLMAHPWILDVSVTRIIPSRLLISVMEQQPLAIIIIGESGELLVNVSGQPFKKLDPARDREVLNLPRIAGLELATGNEGYGFSGPLFDNVMDLLGLQGIEPIRTIKADPDTGLEVQIPGFFAGVSALGAGNLTLRLGFSEYAFKLSRGIVIDRYVRETYAGRQLGTIDLYDPDSITVTLKADTTVTESTKGGV
ncbi:MAG: FtsQ-type POTRA domain-containing protein [Pseudomonadota bacterium]